MTYNEALQWTTIPLHSISASELECYRCLQLVPSSTKTKISFGYQLSIYSTLTPPKAMVGHTHAGASFMTTPHTSTGMEPAYNLDIQKVSTRIVLPTNGIAMLNTYKESTLRTCDIHWKEQTMKDLIT